jgi:hypothetical protein
MYSFGVMLASIVGKYLEAPASGSGSWTPESQSLHTEPDGDRAVLSSSIHCRATVQVAISKLESFPVFSALLEMCVMENPAARLSSTLALPFTDAGPGSLAGSDPASASCGPAAIVRATCVYGELCFVCLTHFAV